MYKCTPEATAIYAPQDATVPEIVAIVRAQIAQCAWMRGRFEELIRGKEDWFSRVESAARELGYVLIPTRPTK